MILSDKLQQYRKLNKYSQEKLAELLGVSRQAVTKWENGVSAPSTENLIKLSAIYKIPLDDLINDKPEVTKVDSEPKRKSKLKMIGSLWAMVLSVIFVVGIFSKGMNALVVWYLFMLALNITIILTVIYFLILLAKALNKYIQNSR